MLSLADDLSRRPVGENFLPVLMWCWAEQKPSMGPFLVVSAFLKKRKNLRQVHRVFTQETYNGQNKNRQGVSMEEEKRPEEQEMPAENYDDESIEDTSEEQEMPAAYNDEESTEDTSQEQEAAPVRKKKHITKKVVIPIVLVLAAAGIFLFLRQRQAASDTSTSTVEVRTYTITKTSLEETVVADGTVESQSETDVTTDLQYAVASINLEVGDEVQAGDVICVLDTTELEEQIARQQEQNAETLEEMAQNVQNLLDNKEYVWNQKPSDDVSEDSDEYLQWARNFASANGSYLDALEEYNDALANGVDDDHALEDLLTSLEECTITAPVSGTITELNATVGSSIDGVVAVISDINNLQVSVYVDEYDIVSLEKGMSATVTSDVVDGQEFAATVISTSPVSTGSGYEVVVSLDEATDQLLIGMDAEVTITVSEEDDVFLAPLDAVGTDDAGNSVVYVQQSDGSFSAVTVTTGTSSDYYVVISGDGIEEGTVIRASANEDEAAISTATAEATTASGGLTIGGTGGQQPQGGANAGGAPQGGMNP
jgi:multidrug efflux pump subunit AcrA (membrane-fusion protein)